MLSKETADILSETKEFIANGDYESAYNYVLSKTLDGIHLYTEALLYAGIDPLKRITRVPDGYLHLCEDRELVVTIPDNITVIGLTAFTSCEVKKIIIPDSVKEIEGYSRDAFWFVKATIQCTLKVKELIEGTGISELKDIKWEIV